MIVSIDSKTIENAVRTILRPLIEADGGTIDFVSAAADEVVLRLGGSYGGCPGVPYVKTDVIEPLLRIKAPGDYAVRYERG